MKLLNFIVIVVLVVSYVEQKTPAEFDIAAQIIRPDSNAAIGKSNVFVVVIEFAATLTFEKVFESQQMIKLLKLLITNYKPCNIHTNRRINIYFCKLVITCFKKCPVCLRIPRCIIWVKWCNGYATAVGWIGNRQVYCIVAGI